MSSGFGPAFSVTASGASSGSASIVPGVGQVIGAAKGGYEVGSYLRDHSSTVRNVSAKVVYGVGNFVTGQDLSPQESSRTAEDVESCHIS